jgi:hypothetical protein
MIDGQLATIGAHRAGAVEYSPDSARLVRPGVGTLLFLGLRDEHRPRRILRTPRLERRLGHAQQLLNRQLGVLVAALAVVVVEQRPSRVEQVAGRPSQVAVQLPDLVLGVDHDRVGHLEPLHCSSDRIRVAGRREPRRVDADDPQASLRVALVPGPHVREGADRIWTAEVPELDQHGAAALLVHAQGGHVDPRQLGRERRGVDVVCRRAHGRRW